MFVNEPPIVVVPVGRVTVPVAIERLPVKVSVEVENDQLPPTPVKARLLNEDAPRLIEPVEVPTKVTVPVCGIKALLFTHDLRTLILNPDPDALSVSSAPIVTDSEPTFPAKLIVFVVPSITTYPILVLVVADFASLQVLLPVPSKVVVPSPDIFPPEAIERLPPTVIEVVPLANVPKLIANAPSISKFLAEFQVAAPLVSPNVTLKKLRVLEAVTVELEVVAVKIILDCPILNVPFCVQEPRTRSVLVAGENVP